MNQLDKRLANLERDRVMAEGATGGQVHQSVEHIAAVVEALEAVGAIHYPVGLPESERLADVLCQLADMRNEGRYDDEQI